SIRYSDKASSRRCLPSFAARPDAVRRVGGPLLQLDFGLRQLLAVLLAYPSDLQQVLVPAFRLAPPADVGPSHPKLLVDDGQQVRKTRGLKPFSVPCLLGFQSFPGRDGDHVAEEAGQKAVP